MKRFRRGALVPSWWTEFTCGIGEAFRSPHAKAYCRWRWAAPEMVEKSQFELEDVLAFFAFPAPWRHRLRTTNLGEGWFKHLRRYLSRFPGCRNAEHSERVGGFTLAAESTHR